MGWFKKLRAKVKGWKTRCAASALLVLGIVETLDQNAVIQVLGDGSKGYVSIAFAIAFFILRQNTNTAAGSGDA